MRKEVFFYLSFFSDQCCFKVSFFVGSFLLMPILACFLTDNVSYYRVKEQTNFIKGVE